MFQTKWQQDFEGLVNTEKGWCARYAKKIGISAMLLRHFRLVTKSSESNILIKNGRQVIFYEDK